MNAAIYYGPGDIRVQDISEPRLEPDGILVRVKACGICGSDMHPYRVGGLIRPGTIMGHEFSGDVVEVGANVQDIKKGDRVTVAGYLPCGECYWCKRKQYYRCFKMRLLGYEFPGAFAEYVSVPLALLNTTIFLLPDELTCEEGATVEPLSVGVHAARVAEPAAADTVVILGVGMIGQCAMQVFKAMGAAKVIVSEISKKRLEVAKATGADVVINATEEDPIERVREATSGMWADIVAECAGSPATFHQAIEMVRGGGKIVLVGIYEEPIKWEPAAIIHKNVRMIGCLGGSFPRAIDFLRSRKVNTKSLITHEFSLDKAREAFETQLKTDEVVKVLVKP